MPVQVSCLRHGVTDRNAKGVFSGMGTEGLTEEARLGLAAADFEATGFDAIYCSPAVRCVETATSLGIAHHIEEPRLAERDFGLFEGLTADECRERHPEEFEAFRRLDAHFVIPGGESRAQHLARITDWLQEVEAHRRVLAVTHGGTIDFLYRLGSGGPLHGGGTVFAGPNAALSVFDVEWPSVTVRHHGMTLAP